MDRTRELDDTSTRIGVMLRILLIALSLITSTVPGRSSGVFGFRVAVQDEGDVSETDPSIGTLVGHIELGEGIDLVRPPQVILMSSFWEEIWSASVQRSLDLYSSQYRAAVARNPAAFREIAEWSYREAVSSVVLRMQESMGADFPNWVQAASEDGGFAFPRVPLGNYRILAVAFTNDGVLIWSEAVDVPTALPQYLAVQNRVP